MNNRTNIIIVIVLSIFIVIACAVNPVTGQKQMSFMSEAQEIALGKQSDPEVIAQYGLYPSDTLQKFINEKGKEMAKISHRPELQYEFRILDSDVLNAFAVPGGYVYFTRGIMAYFNNEAQFAGVLGHEIGHIAARHSAQQYTKQMLGQVALIGGMIFSEAARNNAESLMQGMQLMFLKFSRDDETQSDKLGVNYSSTVGYDAKEMALFFKTLERASAPKDGARLPEFLSTHPDPGNRYVDVTNLATQWQIQKGSTNLKVNRDGYLKMIDGIVYGQDPRQGYLEKETSIFYQPEMKFQYPIPSGWQYQNSPSQVQAVAPDGNAGLILTLSEQKTAQAAANDLIQKYQLKVVNTGVAQKVNGLNAYHFLAQQPTQQQTTTSTQQQEPATLLHTTCIEYNGNVYLLIGIADANNYPKYKPNFVASTNGFKQLTDEKKMNVLPERIKIVNVTKTSTLAQVLNQYNIPTTRHEELAILNGMETTTSLSAGTLVKVIEKKR